MTRDELITTSTQELGKLPADELEIIARHFETEDRAELARRLAEEAEEMWSGDHEAPVPQAEWPAAHLQLLLGMHRDEQREVVLNEQRRVASDVIDGLEPARRALLCWRFHTIVQRRVVALAAAATVRAMEEDLVKLTSFKEAAQVVIDFEIDQQIDETEDHYYHGADQHRRDSTSSSAATTERAEDEHMGEASRDERVSDPRELDPSTRAALGLVSDEDAARFVVEFLADRYARGQVDGEPDDDDVMVEYAPETELMKPWGFKIMLYRLKGPFTHESELIKTLTVDVYEKDSWDVTWHHDTVPEKSRDNILEVIGRAIDAAYDPMSYDPEDRGSNVFGPGDLAAPATVTPANDPPVRNQGAAAGTHPPGRRGSSSIAPGENESWVRRFEWVLQEEYGVDATRSRLLARRLAAETLRMLESTMGIPNAHAMRAAFAWLEHEQLDKMVIDGLMRTAEDLLSGAAEPADCPPGARAFVVHHHDAARMHFDLRLELGGVLKCWTLPKVPELKPGDRRLAIHVEDHPHAWLNFRGAVPAMYGAGTVDVWDVGCWYGDDDVRDGYRKGRFSFYLSGKRLKGRYTLLRFRGRDEGDTWLLIREEGDKMPAQPSVRSSALPGTSTHKPPVSTSYTSASQAAMRRYAVAGWPPTAMASAGRGRRPAAQKPTRGRNVWDAIAAETERRVIEKESELVATMDRLARIYSGGRLAGRRVRPGTIVVERVSGTPEFPSLVFPDLASIADGFDVGAAMALVKLNPVVVELAGWVDPGGKPSPESDRLTTALEQLGAAWRAGQASEDEFVATRDALWVEAESAGVAVEIAWRLRTKWGTAREPAVAASLPSVPVRANPYVRYKLELYLRQIPTDAFSSVVSRWVRPSHDQIEAGQGAWQRVLELLGDHHSTCSQCPFVFGSNLDCATCRTWVLSLKQPGAPWTAERIGAALYNCNEPAVAAAAVEALAQSIQAPLTAAFFQDFADNFEVSLAKRLNRPEDMDPGYRDHCRKAVEWLLPQPDFPLPQYPPIKGGPRSAAGVDILMRAAPLSAGWRN